MGVEALVIGLRKVPTCRSASRLFLASVFVNCVIFEPVSWLLSTAYGDLLHRSHGLFDVLQF